MVSVTFRIQIVLIFLLQRAFLVWLHPNPVRVLIVIWTVFFSLEKMLLSATRRKFKPLHFLPRKEFSKARETHISNYRNGIRESVELKATSEMGPERAQSRQGSFVLGGAVAEGKENRPSPPQDFHSVGAGTARKTVCGGETGRIFKTHSLSV